MHVLWRNAASDITLEPVSRLACWLDRHGIRHMGETEHVRARVGPGGMR